MYLSKYEKDLTNEYIKKGYIIRKILDKIAFEKINKFVDKQILLFVKKNKIQNKTEDNLNFTHRLIPKKHLNNFRMEVIESLRKNKEIRYLYYKCVKHYLEILVSNELAMQRQINLNIQYPKDKSSLFAVHADSWSGNSPHEAVAWMPLVNCYRTKSMFILPPAKTQKLVQNRLTSFSDNSNVRLYNLIKKDVKWLKINKGEIMIFNQNLPHGNTINAEKETRWSMNCRF